MRGLQTGHLPLLSPVPCCQVLRSLVPQGPQPHPNPAPDTGSRSPGQAERQQWPTPGSANPVHHPRSPGALLTLCLLGGDHAGPVSALGEAAQGGLSVAWAKQVRALSTQPGGAGRVSGCRPCPGHADSLLRNSGPRGWQQDRCKCGIRALGLGTGDSLCHTHSGLLLLSSNVPAPLQGDSGGTDSGEQTGPPADRAPLSPQSFAPAGSAPGPAPPWRRL